jgi:hypothetical protein
VSSRAAALTVPGLPAGTQRAGERATRALRPMVSIVTACAFFVQVPGVAFAAPPDGVQPAAPDPAPQVAPAAPSAPGTDIVYLKNGRRRRGPVIEMIPDDHVTLQFATGRTRVIAWVGIDRVERGVAALPRPPTVAGVAPPPPADPATPAQPAPGPPMPGAPGEPSPTVVVHVNAEPDVRLMAAHAGRTGTPVCAAPCDVQVPVAGWYYVAGDSVGTSGSFHLKPAPGGHVDMEIKTASRAGYVGGIVLLVAGTLGVIIGGGLALGNIGHNCEKTDPLSGMCLAFTNPSPALETAGLVSLAVGAAAVVTGVVLIVKNYANGTRVIQTIADRLSPAPRPETAWLRPSQWSEPSQAAALGQPGTLAFPIFSRSF